MEYAPNRTGTNRFKDGNRTDDLARRRAGWKIISETAAAVLHAVRVLLLGLAATVVTAGVFLGLRDAELPELAVAWLTLAITATLAALYVGHRRWQRAEQDVRRCAR